MTLEQRLYEMEDNDLNAMFKAYVARHPEETDFNELYSDWVELILDFSIAVNKV